MRKYIPDDLRISEQFALQRRINSALIQFCCDTEYDNKFDEALEHIREGCGIQCEYRDRYDYTFIKVYIVNEPKFLLFSLRYL